MKQIPSPLHHLEERLRELATKGLLRSRPEPVEDAALSFCSNDYLGLGGRLVTGAGGAGASRLIVGERPEHVALEAALAAWLGTESSLLFSSGYAANIGVISALAEPGDLVISDRLNHASIIDACRLSRADVVVVPHLDTAAVVQALGHARQRRAWVVTESYFSMDADTPDLVALRRACDIHGAALVVDEAHALGVFGPAGRGLCAAHGVVPDVLVGTLGKAFGSGGAFAAGAKTLVRWLWNRARSFVFSTGLSPVAAAAASRSLAVIREDPVLRQRLLANAERLRGGLSGLGLEPLGHGPIVPLVLGSVPGAMAIAERLRQEGIHVQAVRPPTVPNGTARLRLTTTAAHSLSDIDAALAAIQYTLPWPEPSS